VRIGALAPEKLLVVADTLAKARRWVRTNVRSRGSSARSGLGPALSDSRRNYGRRQDMVRPVGPALLVQHRLADLIEETVTVLPDLMDTQRSRHLEAVVVGLILTEIGMTLFEMVWR
jgi:hypothetical protein